MSWPSFHGYGCLWGLELHGSFRRKNETTLARESRSTAPDMCNTLTERTALRNPMSACQREILLRLLKTGSCGISYSSTYAPASLARHFRYSCLWLSKGLDIRHSQQTLYVIYLIISFNIANNHRCLYRPTSVVPLDCTCLPLIRIECKSRIAQVKVQC